METKQNNNNALVNEVLPIILIIAAYAYKYKDVIEEKLQNPFFIAFLISSAVLLILLFYEAGHHIEKFFNKINMQRFGIKSDDKEKRISFPMVSFDLHGQLNSFFQDNKNQDRTFIGLNAEKNNEEIISMPDIERSHHLQVLGMTGTGKTSGVLLPLIYQDALKNRPLIILDAKGELSSINQLNAMLASIGRAEDLLLFSLVHKDKSCTYNPLYVGECDPQVVIDSFLGNFNDENSFYRETSSRLFTNAFYVLHSLGSPFTVMDAYTYLSSDACRLAIDAQVKKTEGKGVLYMRLLNTQILRLREQYKGWQHVIGGFNNYLFEHREDVLNDPYSDIILTDAIRNRKIVYFQLPTNAYPVQAVSVARMVQANLRYISSLIQTGKMPKDTLVSVIIDEYGSFAEESFVGILNKARSSGMMVTLAHQSLSDLTAISEPFMKLIYQNTVNKIYLRIEDHESCDLISKDRGTYTKEEKTYRMTGGRFNNQIYTGESSNRIVNEFYFPPDKIKNLHEFGQAYLIQRGKNTPVCVNLGYFEHMPELAYEKKIRNNKKDGLRLFEKYYIAVNDNPPSNPPDEPEMPEDQADLGDGQ